jgi:DNA (cytosine-5)-methyltransferase 1
MKRLDGSRRALTEASPPRKVLDLFSGIGGFALAFEAAGFQTVAFAEIEPYPCKVLAQHWPEVPNLGDVRGIDGRDFAGVDVVCGGFPCQPHSSAGLKLGEADPRNLWPEMARIISECRPAFVLAENVPGLSDGFLDGVCADLESLDYSILPIEVPACAVGAPHLGYRLWILAQANSLHAEGVAVQREDAGQIFRADNSPLYGVWLEAPPKPLGLDHGVPEWSCEAKGYGNSIAPALAYPFAVWVASQLEAAQRRGEAPAEPQQDPVTPPLPLVEG